MAGGSKPSREARGVAARGYVLEEQIGHLLRRAHQRATTIFSTGIGPSRLTPTQFAALVKVGDEGAISQNRLGRLTAMDPATIQGVVRRLIKKGLLKRQADPSDRRRMLLRLEAKGRRVVEDAIENGKAISRDTLAPLSRAQRETLLRLLKKLT